MQKRTPPQQESIEHVKGPLLVVAGAGSGKTTVLSERIARLISQGHAAPHEILAITYNRSAALHLKHKVKAALQAAGVPADPSELNAYTFHAYCDGLLRAHRRHFDVIDETDLKVHLTLHVEELPLERFIRAAKPGEFIRELMSFIARCQDEMLDSASFSKFVDELESGERQDIPRVVKSKEVERTSREECIARCREIARVFTQVEAMLAQKGWGTYGKMISGAVSLLREDAAALSAARERAKFVLVDEFQDSNFAQLELMELLAGSDKNIFAVGDPDQAIYKFRGASSAAFDEFKHRFPSAGVVYLDTNFRSTTQVLQTAFSSIDKNPAPHIADGQGRSFARVRLKSGVDEARQAKGESIENRLPELLVTPDDGTEAHMVVNRLEAIQAETGCAWSDFAILHRSHAHREEVVERLAQRNIPFFVHGEDVAGCSEVLDTAAAFRAVLRKAQAVDFMRLAALPEFRVDGASLQAAFARDGAALPAEPLMKTVKGGEAVLKAVHRLRERIEKQACTAAEALEMTRAVFKIPDAMAIRTFRDFVKKWQDGVLAGDKSLAEFCKYFECFLQVGGKINGIKYLEDAEENSGNAVNVMTVHAAKGLEYEHVFVLRCNPLAFPQAYRETLFEFPLALSNTRLVGLPPADELHEQEERRLFYVALTRAKKSLTICGKRKYDKLQGFVAQLQADKRLAGVLRLHEVKETMADIDAAAAAPSTLAGWLYMPIPPPSGDTTLSASAIQDYESCPLRYKLQRLWKVPGEYSAAQQYGSAVHQVLHGYYLAVQSGRRLDEATVLASFEDAMQRARFDNELQLQLYRKQGRKSLKAFVQSQAGQPLPPVRQLEQTFLVEIGGVKIKGRFDRVDDDGAGGAIIEDFKTGRPLDQEKADKSLQLTIYQLAAEALGWKVSGLRLYNVEDNSTVTTERSEVRLGNMKQKVAKVAAKIRAGEFPPKQGQCGYCDYRSICPEHEKRPVHPAMAAKSIQ